jgi:ABC-type transport system involved in cytochrome bd biosynthesis fused ATPase/permease subunit
MEFLLLTITFRFNLDPGKNHTDEELWYVLEKTGLKNSVEVLDAEIGFSQGQRQLLSIARAILRHSKVHFSLKPTMKNVTEFISLSSYCVSRLFSLMKPLQVLIVKHRLPLTDF